jgi:Arc/MetJ-type ribon-helix-helix transcriptional regulator
METISLKIDENMEKKISSIMKDFNFSTKTEFIREAIRKNLQEYEIKREKKAQWKKLLSMKGALKGKTKNLSDEEFRKIREEIGNKILNEYELSK